MGKESSLFSYHQCIDVIKGFYIRKYYLKAHANQGYIVSRFEGVDVLPNPGLETKAEMLIN